MKHFIGKPYALILVACCLFLIVGDIRAQDIVPRIGVSPHTFQLQVLPGETIEQKIKIFNQSEYPMPMTTKVADFTAADETGQMIIGEASGDPFAASRFWFKIENPDFILDPGEVESVKFQINVPEDADPGGYYAVIVFEPRLPSFYFEEEAILKNIPEIGVLFLTSVQKFTLEPELKQKLEIAEFSLSKEKRLVGLENLFSRFAAALLQVGSVNIVEGPPASFILRIKNNDIYHIKPSGRILIYNSFGKKAGEIEITQKTILPGKTRAFGAEFEPEVPERLKWLPASLANFLVQNFFIGKYQARLELQVKSPTAIEVIQLDIPITLNFFSFPWKFWLPVILILGTIILFSWKYRERIKRAVKVLFTRQKIEEKVK